MTRARRRPSATSAFGAGRREGHDASAFYARFSPALISTDDDINPPRAVDEISCGDARAMDEVAPASVALVVTSPPYFAGKQYEEALGENGVPASYLGYLDMLQDVFAQCVAKLEPGGRIAVNVANLGRRPYRSLAADVVTILQDRLGLLLRGEIVWRKARGASGSCAWGSWRSPANPVLRDVTERIVVASKGRFDRARTRAARARTGLPCEPTLTRDEFLEATTDLWEIAPESATRVGHPAPFPVELPLRLIHLYTYRGDLVLDPFMGSGSTAVAAVRAGRRYVGYDTDPGYVARARQRVAAERAADPGPPGGAVEHAADLLRRAGFDRVRPGHKLPGGVDMDLCAVDGGARRWCFDVCGTFTVASSGLRSSDALWAALGRAAVLTSCDPGVRVVLLTTALPPPGTPGDAALRAARGGCIVDALDLLDPATCGRLGALARA